MTVKFTKMNGAGNDFIVIDNRDGRVALTPTQVAALCHRQRGIGADGVLLLLPSRHRRGDWAWDFYNSDGSVADMCGNGARCFARFIQRLGLAGGGTSFETGAGVIAASFDGPWVTVGLTPPKELRLSRSVELAGGVRMIHSINTGVPHAVLFVPDADKAMVESLGAEVRYHEMFAPKGTNVNFVQILKPGLIRVRTYERGVEGETLACGTGVAASGLVTAALERWESPVRVQVQGGDELEVRFRPGAENWAFEDVQLKGPAEVVFEGSIDLAT